MALTVDALLEQISGHLATLDATPFLQDVDGEVWHEAENPLTPIGEPEPLAHLAFAVVADDSPFTDPNRISSGDDAQAATSVSVIFTYRLRPDRGMEDFRQSFVAARAVVRALNADTWATGEATTIPINGGTPLLMEGEPFVMQRIQFRILHDYGV